MNPTQKLTNWSAQTVYHFSTYYSFQHGIISQHRKESLVICSSNWLKLKIGGSVARLYSTSPELPSAAELIPNTITHAPHVACYDTFRGILNRCLILEFHCIYSQLHTTVRLWPNKDILSTFSFFVTTCSLPSRRHVWRGILWGGGGVSTHAHTYSTDTSKKVEG